MNVQHMMQPLLHYMMAPKGQSNKVVFPVYVLSLNAEAHKKSLTQCKGLINADMETSSWDLAHVAQTIPPQYVNLEMQPTD